MTDWHPSPGMEQSPSGVRHVAFVDWAIEQPIRVGEKFVVLKCPRCGVDGGVGLVKARMNPDGTMLRRYRCPSAGCSFNDFVKLVDWDPNSPAKCFERPQINVDVTGYGDRYDGKSDRDALRGEER